MQKHQTRKIKCNGKIIEGILLFTMDFEGKKYALIRHKYQQDSCSVYGVVLNNFLEMCLVDAYIPEELKEIVKIIDEKSSLMPEKYECEGEHYVIRKDYSSESAKYRIKKLKKCFSFSYDRTSLINFAKYLVTLAMGCAWLSYHIYTADYVVVGSVLFFIGRDLLPFAASEFYLLITTVQFWFVDRSKDFMSMLLDAMLPLFLIFLFALMRTNEIFIWLTVLLFASCITFAVFRKVKNNASKTRMDKEKIRAAFSGISYGLLILGIISVYVINIFGINLSVYEVPEAHEKYDETVYEDYQKAIEKIEIEKWEKLTVDEQIEVIRDICDYESYESLGIVPPEMVIVYKGNNNVLGSYNCESDLISINKDYFVEADTDEIIETLLHELRHKWQREIVKFYEELDGTDLVKYSSLSLFDDARDFRDSFNNYVSGEDDFFDYYFQEVESDARNWAEENLWLRYMSLIYPAEEESSELQSEINN